MISGRLSIEILLSGHHMTNNSGVFHWGLVICSSLIFLLYHFIEAYFYIVVCVHRVRKKTKQICFCQNFVKFPPISIIFGRKMGNGPSICEVHSLSTSPNLRHHLTVLNANVPNCYITQKLSVIDRSHWRP